MARDPKVTRKIMASVKSKNTEPERMLRRALWKKGYRYRVNDRRLPGKPDIVIPKARIAIFCDGDFWHGHNWAVRGIPSLEEELSSYSEYWREKILRNIERDKQVTRTLEDDGWTVLRFWESEIRASLDRCVFTVDSEYLRTKIQDA